MNKNNRVFKNFFLYQTFQKKLIFFIVVINLISTGIFYIGTQRFFNIFVNKGEQLGIPKYHVFYRFINNLKFEMDLIFLGATLVSLIIITIGAYIISNKVSGPLYRLREELKKMNANGDIHSIKFRKGDYILDIQDEFNKLSDKLKSVKDENN